MHASCWIYDSSPSPPWWKMSWSIPQLILDDDAKVVKFPGALSPVKLRKIPCICSAISRQGQVGGGGGGFRSFHWLVHNCFSIIKAIIRAIAFSFILFVSSSCFSIITLCGVIIHVARYDATLGQSEHAHLYNHLTNNILKLIISREWFCFNIFKAFLFFDMLDIWGHESCMVLALNVSWSFISYFNDDCFFKTAYCLFWCIVHVIML